MAFHIQIGIMHMHHQVKSKFQIIFGSKRSRILQNLSNEKSRMKFYMNNLGKIKKSFI